MPLSIQIVCAVSGSIGTDNITGTVTQNDVFNGVIHVFDQVVAQAST